VPVSRYAIYFVIAAGGCAADLVSKQLVFDWLGVAAPFVDPRDPANFARWRGDRQVDHLWWLWNDHLGIQTSINTGALFGMGAGGWPIFATLSLVALVGIFTWLFILRAAHDRWLTVALAFVTGGILGNLYDRLGMHQLVWRPAYLGQGHTPGERVYAVRDWLHFKIEPIIDWPIFNIADSMLVCGAALMIRATGLKLRSH
jgi:signal peptidase II